MQITVFDKSREFSEIVIPTVQTKSGMDDLIHLLDSYCATTRMLIVSGEPGTGKTVLLRKFTETYQTKYATEEHHKNIIMLNVSTQNKSSEDLAVEILKQLGDIAPTLGTLSKKKIRIETLFAALQVRVLIIDEFHDLIPKSNMDGNNKVIRLIKWILLNNTRPVSLVLSGCPAIEDLIVVDQQIETRCNNIIKMEKLGLTTSEKQSEFADLVVSLFKEMPNAIKVDLKKPLTYQRLMLASQGNVRTLTAILKRSIEMVELDGAITNQVLEDAWDKCTTKKMKDEIGIRPFTANESKIHAELKRLKMI